MRNIEIDACGLICPEPIMEAQKKIKELTNGKTLIVYIDSELAGYNLMDWAEGSGFEPEMTKAEDGRWKISIKAN